jgi:hypothetical protein
MNNGVGCSGFRNVFSKFTSHTVQKCQNQKNKVSLLQQYPYSGVQNGYSSVIIVTIWMLLCKCWVVMLYGIVDVMWRRLDNVLRFSEMEKRTIAVMLSRLLSVRLKSYGHELDGVSLPHCHTCWHFRLPAPSGLCGYELCCWSPCIVNRYRATFLFVENINWNRQHNEVFVVY